MKTAKKTSKWLYAALVLLILLLVGVTLLRNIPLRWVLPQAGRPQEMGQIYIDLARDHSTTTDSLTISDPAEIAWICDQLAGEKLIYRGPKWGGGIPFGGDYGDLLSIRIEGKFLYIREDGQVYLDSSSFALTKGGSRLFYALMDRYYTSAE